MRTITQLYLIASKTSVDLDSVSIQLEHKERRYRQKSKGPYMIRFI